MYVVKKLYTDTALIKFVIEKHVGAHRYYHRLREDGSKTLQKCVWYMHNREKIFYWCDAKKKLWKTKMKAS